MNAKIEEAIKKQVRFEWEERAAAWGRNKYMTEDEKFAEDILVHLLEMDPDQTDRALIQEMDQAIRNRYNKACDAYDRFLDNLGPKY